MICPRGGSSPLTRGKPFPLLRARERRGLIPAHAGKTRGFARRKLGAGAHPRSRGENGGIGTHDQADEGSSPLTRGKRRGGELVGWPSGLIPAHAGKT